MALEEEDASVELMTSWELKGERNGKSELVADLIRWRLGRSGPDLQERLDALTSIQLSDLAKALFDFTTERDLDEWFSRAQVN